MTKRSNDRRPIVHRSSCDLHPSQSSCATRQDTNMLSAHRIACLPEHTPKRNSSAAAALTIRSHYSIAASTRFPSPIIPCQSSRLRHILLGPSHIPPLSMDAIVRFHPSTYHTSSNLRRPLHGHDAGRSTWASTYHTSSHLRRPLNGHDAGRSA